MSRKIVGAIMEPDVGARIYLKKITKQISCYEEILNISKEQFELVHNGYYVDLPAAVRKREKVLRKLGVLQYVIQAYTHYWKNTMHLVDNDVNDSIAEALEKLYSVLDVLRQCDSELKVSSTNELTKIRQKLQDIKNNKNKANAYKKPIVKPVNLYINKVSI